MRSLYQFYLLVDKYASEIEKLNLDGDALEEYSTLLLRLQYQIESREPNENVVNQCIESLKRFTTDRHRPAA